MTTYDEAVAIRAGYESALRALKEAGASKACNGLEQRYGLAARMMVAAGLMAPLKRKYRGW